MKNTFLVFNDPMNPDSGLRVANIQEWDQILKRNKTLPRTAPVLYHRRIRGLWGN